MKPNNISNTNELNGKSATNLNKTLLQREVEKELKTQTENNMNHEEKVEKTKNEPPSNSLLLFLYQFFIFCSGGNREVLENDASVKERDNYLKIGTVVFLTWILTSLSGGYALFTIFDSPVVAGLLGTFWGNIIFTFDRLFVGGIKKNKSKSKMLLQVLPRITLGIFLGVIISKPIENRFFAKEINEYLVAEQKNSFDSEINRIQKEIKVKKEERNQIAKSCDDEKDAMIQEADGTGGSGIPNLGPIYQQKKMVYEQCQKSISSQLTKIDQQIESKQQDIQQVNPTSNIESPSALKQMIIINKLAKQERLIFWISLSITCLLVIIEILPILAKMSISDGTYDQAMDTKAKVIETLNRKKLKDEKDKITNFYKQQKNIRQKFWEECGGVFYKVFAEQIVKTYYDIKDNNDLVKFRNKLRKHLSQQMNDELEDFIKNIKLNPNEQQNKNDRKK